MKINDYSQLLDERLRSSMCEHENVEYEYDYEDGFAFVEAAQCEDCGKDLYDSLSDAEVAHLSEAETVDVKARAIDSAIDHQREVDAGLV